VKLRVSIVEPLNVTGEGSSEMIVDSFETDELDPDTAKELMTDLGTYVEHTLKIALFEVD
jgi:hypothetical protein